LFDAGLFCGTTRVGRTGLALGRQGVASVRGSDAAKPKTGSEYCRQDEQQEDKLFHVKGKHKAKHQTAAAVRWPSRLLN